VQWQVSSDHGATFHDIAGATSVAYSGTASLADSTKQFRAVFTNPTGTATTNAATLTVAPVVPDAPTIGSATGGNSQATVGFTPPAWNGGSDIVNYKVTCASNRGATMTATGTTSPISVRGLWASKPYTCNVSARNAVGSSGPSGASNTIVPTGITITTDTLPSAQHGTFYTTALSASGGTPPFPWKKLTALPRGLGLRPRLGTISGKPRTPGRYSITIQLFDRARPKDIATKTFTIT
jgi:large repetitive protein